MISGAGSPAPAGFGFRSSGGVGAVCACESGFGWQKQGDHPCGCAPETSISLFSVTSGAGSSMLASAAPVSNCPNDGCCCIKDVCVKPLAAKVLDRPLTREQQQQLGTTEKTIRLINAPIIVSMETQYKLDKGGNCRTAVFKEALQRWMPGGGCRVPPTPTGYDPKHWDPNGWNSAIEHHLGWPQVSMLLEASMNAKVGSVEIADDVNIPQEFAFLQFFRLESGCRDSSCLDCCLMVLGQSTPASADNQGVLYSVKIKCAAAGQLKCDPPKLERPVPCVGSHTRLSPLMSPFQTGNPETAFQAWEPAITAKQTAAGFQRICYTK